MPRKSKIAEISRAGTLPRTPPPESRALTVSPTESEPNPSDVRGITDEQAVWLSYRAQCRTDEQATHRTNTNLVLEPPITNEEVQLWYQQEDFGNLVTSMVGVPTVKSFQQLSEFLFPEAFRALRALLTSDDNRGKSKGLELLLKMHGLLVEKVKVDSPNDINALTGLLREVRSIAVVETYSRSPDRGRFQEGEFRDAGGDEGMG